MAKSLSQSRKPKKVIVVPFKKLLFVWFVGATIGFGVVAVGCFAIAAATSSTRLAARLYVCGALMAVASLAALGGLIVSALKRPRLLIGPSYLRLLHGRGTVAGQIPLDNIKSLNVAKHVDVWGDGDGQQKRTRYVLEITLIDRDDRDTCWTSFVRNKTHHIEIANEFEKNLEWILKRLQQRIDALQDRDDKRD